MRVEWITLLLMAAMSCASPDRCVVPAPSGLNAAAAPSESELRVLLREVEERSRLPAKLARDIRGLRIAMDGGSADDRCRALRSARSSLASMGDQAETAAQRSAVTLVLDLTALALTRTAR